MRISILSGLACCLSLVVQSKLAPLKLSNSMTTPTKPVDKPASKGVQLPQSVKLLIGAGGIYSAFLYYGTLQEDVFHYKAPDGTKFKSAWFLQALG